MNCPSCNTPVPAGAAFCDNCGADLRNAAGGPAPAQAPVAAPPPGGGVTCATCGSVNVAGSSFCENCGSALGNPPPQQQYQPPQQQYQPPQQQYQPPQQQYQPPAYQPPVSPGYVTGRLVIQGSNTNIPIPPGKQTVTIGREDPVSSIFPEIDLEAHGGHDAGVGRQHARLIAQGGQVLLEDLNSVNGTALNKQKVLPGQPRPVNNGDELRFGKVIATYYSS